jgi:hypothetical protein
LNFPYIAYIDFYSIFIGSLDSISLQLDSSVLFSDRLGAEFAVIVTDPDGRIAQVMDSVHLL